MLEGRTGNYWELEKETDETTWRIQRNGLFWPTLEFGIKGAGQHKLDNG
jgi:hypothetical protein